MKNQILLYFLIAISIFSCKKDSTYFLPKNPLKNIVTVEKQVFDLDTITYKEIIGKKGTKIYFDRNNFEISENDSIRVILKEFYNRLELISENLSTVTNKNELLESNGVIYLDIQANGKSIKLKENEKIEIKFANKIQKNERIFIGSFDSLNQTIWTQKDSSLVTFELLDSVVTRRFGGVETFREIVIPIDSLEYYQTLNQNKLLDDSVDDLLDSEIMSDCTSTEINYTNLYYPSFLINEFGWINLDKILYPNATVSYELILNREDITHVCIYILYEGTNALITQFREVDNLKFKDIPLVGETSLLIIGAINSISYVDKIELNNQSSGIININLVKIDSSGIEKLVKE
jgi:hypothetical protein